MWWIASRLYNTAFISSNASPPKKTVANLKSEPKIMISLLLPRLTLHSTQQQQHDVHSSRHSQQHQHQQHLWIIQQLFRVEWSHWNCYSTSAEFWPGAIWGIFIIDVTNILTILWPPTPCHAFNVVIQLRRKNNWPPCLPRAWRHLQMIPRCIFVVTYNAD